MGYNHQHYGTAGFFYLHTVPGILAWDRFSVLKSRHNCRERSINMDNWLARTRLLLGDEAVNSLRHHGWQSWDWEGSAVPRRKPSAAAA